MMKREASRDSSLAASKNSRTDGQQQQQQEDDEEFLEYDCLICTNAIDIFGVFDCGHYCCAICALRIYKFAKKPEDRVCPMCRTATKHLRVLETPPEDEYHYDMDKLKLKAFYQDKLLKCSVETKELRDRLTKLYEFLCPDPGCWQNGTQEQFTHFHGLKEHLSKEHKIRYCNLCIENRPSFLCEQITYTDKEHDDHNKGKCGKDPVSFMGHPMCLWCKKRFYDGEALLKHMQADHFSCDICNRGEFTFVFYKNRDKLNQHFATEHVLCDHVDCVNLDPMLRVFAGDIELIAHQQKVHGAGTRDVSLESLGFSYGGGRPTGRGGRSPAPAASSTTAGGGAFDSITENPATGRDVTASTITFDNVTSREVVSMMPKTKHRTTTKEVKQTDNELQLASQVIPMHYETPEVLANLKRIRIKIEPEAPPPKAASSSAATSPSKGENGETKKVADDLSPEEYNAILKEKLPQFLPKKSLFDDFKQASADFLQNKLMATEYYTKLASHFFSKEQMGEIFEPLAYSLTNPTKRAALIAAKKMMQSKESQQRIEEERKAHDEAVRDDKRAAKQQLGGWKRTSQPPLTSTSGKKPPGSAALGADKAGKGKKNVWAAKGQERAKPTLGTQDNFNLNNNTPASLIGGSMDLPPPPATIIGSTRAIARMEEQHVDPDQFPDLGSAGPSRQAWGTKKGTGTTVTLQSNKAGGGAKKGPPGSAPVAPQSSSGKKIGVKQNPWLRE